MHILQNKVFVLVLAASFTGMVVGLLIYGFHAS